MVRSSDEMVRLSAWVREQNAAGVVPVRINAGDIAPSCVNAAAGAA